LADTLDSVANQSYKDFEVIIINDGSTDSTQDIIDEYCNKHLNFRYIYQENQGVASARNIGIELAKGEYLGFLDGDDLYPQDTLKYYNETINLSKIYPDVIIGQVVQISPWRQYSQINAKKLSNQEIINPIDNKILWTVSMCNKIFSKEIVKDSNRLVPLLSYGEDVAFTLPLIYSSNLIVGCPHEVLFVKKRFSKNYSLTQKVSTKLLEDYIHAYEIVHDEFIKLSNDYRKKYSDDKIKLSAFEDEYLIYLDEFQYRKCSILISEFYRHFWKSDKESIEKIKKEIESFKSQMFPSTRERLEKNNQDLFIRDLITDKGEMAENPLVTIAIDPNIKGTSLNKMLYNINEFHFPSFEVFLPNKSFDSIPDFFKEKEYINSIDYSFKSHDDDSKSNSDFKNAVLKRVNGKFLYYLDKEVVMSLDLLKRMFDRIHDSEFDFVAMGAKPLVERDFSKKNYETSEFSKLESVKSDNLKYYNYFYNKLIKIDFLKENNFVFTENTYNDIKKFYEIGNYSDYGKTFILINDNYLKNPFISFIIDDIKISSEELNKLFESIYEQKFKSFDVILNENLKSKLNREFLEKLNLIILENSSYNDFKKIAINKSNSKYVIFVDIPVMYDSDSIKNLFTEIEESEYNQLDKSKNKKYAFSSSPLHQLKYGSDGKKIIKEFSSQALIYTYKDFNVSSYRSKFMTLDFHLANKLFNLDNLRKNNIYFENPHDDVLNLYKNFRFSKVYQKSILTQLNQKCLFKSKFLRYNIPFFTKILYKIHKMIFVLMISRRALKNSAD